MMINKDNIIQYYGTKIDKAYEGYDFTSIDDEIIHIKDIDFNMSYVIKGNSNQEFIFENCKLICNDISDDIKEVTFINCKCVEISI